MLGECEDVLSLFTDVTYICFLIFLCETIFFCLKVSHVYVTIALAHVSNFLSICIEKMYTLHLIMKFQFRNLLHKIILLHQ